VLAGQEKALGARVLKIHQTPVARAVELLLALASRDENPPLAQSFAEAALTTGGTLHGLGIVPDRQTARYTLADDAAHEFTLDVHASEAGAAMTLVRPYQKPPLYRENPESKFWCRYLPEAGTLYCNAREMRNLYSVAKEIPDLVAQHHPDKLAIDLRRNHGGDYTVGERYLVRPIRDLAAINRKGHLFVLVSAVTFSAAMINAAQFRDETNAILVGQTIGEKPSSYAEPRNMTLPNSHLTMRYSTRYYDFARGGENVIRPDREIIPTWSEYKEGRDPVLEWVFGYSAK